MKKKSLGLNAFLNGLRSVLNLIFENTPLSDNLQIKDNLKQSINLIIK